MIIEKEAAQSWHDMQRAIDELNSNGNEIPVYRAALTLPLTQAGITAVVGAIAEYPSGFTLFLLNTGGAGEVFLICAIDGIWRVWTVTPSSGGMPLIDPATADNLAIQSADGSLYDAGFGAGAFDPAGTTATHAALTGTAVHGLGTTSLLDSTAVGEDLVTAVDVNAARVVLGLAPIALPAKNVDHMAYTYATTFTGSGATSTTGFHRQLSTGATASSTSRVFINNNNNMLGRSATFVDWQLENTFTQFFRLGAANPEGVFRVFFGKLAADAFGVVSGSYVGYEIQDNLLVSGLVANAGAPTTVALTDLGSITFKSVTIIVKNGTVTWYVDGVVVGSTTVGPTTNSNGTISFEINNGATPANYVVNFWSNSTH